MAKTKIPELARFARDLAEEQVKTDEERTRAFPSLLRRKMTRMSASPLAFLRGAAPLFYELLKHHPELGDGPDAAGWIVGDLHMENFGAYRPDGFDDGDKKRPAVFDLNDFDDCIVGPWRFDVLRFSTSLLLAGRELGVNGPTVLTLLDNVLDAWSRSAFDGEKPADPPPCVQKLIDRVRTRSKTQLLDGRTKESGGKRKFILGERYMALDEEIAEQVPKALETYIASIAKDERPKEVPKLEDCAFRVAGTGSLGALRIAVLVEKNIYDLKEQGDPSAATILGVPSIDNAERVLAGFRACVAHPASMLGTSHIKLHKKKVSLSCRRLSPQEDKLSLPDLDGSELPELATFLGGLLGAAHARGTQHANKRWSKGDRDTVRQQAITLAGIHEAIYIALCERMRTL